MAQLDVLNWDKSVVAQVEVSDQVVNTDVREDYLHQVVRWQRAKRRQGTHSVKTRSTITGSSKKPFRQKGTGNARQGNRRSPLLEGGAVVHGPQPRNYEFKLTKSFRQKALASAVSLLHREGRCFVLESVDQDSGKTKELAQKLEKFGVQKAVIVGSGQEAMTTRAARNLRQFKYLAIEGLNVYDLLKYDAVLVSKDVLPTLESRCGVK